MTGASRTCLQVKRASCSRVKRKTGFLYSMCHDFLETARRGEGNAGRPSVGLGGTVVSPCHNETAYEEARMVTRDKNRVATRKEVRDSRALHSAHFRAAQNQAHSSAHHPTAC